MTMITRSYNTIKEERNLIYKSSNNDKLSNEANYYKLIEKSNKKMKVLFPKFVEYHFNGKYNEHTLVIERIPYDNIYVSLKKRKNILEDKFIYFSSPFVKCVISSLEELNEEREPFSINTVKELENSWHDMYVKKTEREFNKIQQIDTNKVIPTKHSIVLNGKTYKNFNEIWFDVRRKYFEKNKAKYVPYIHGDFCFSNILMSDNFSMDDVLLKFIDMRGSYGNHIGTSGDLMYDYAKLLHSLEGNYEEIIYDDFEIFSYRGEFFYEPSNQLKIFKEISLNHLKMNMGDRGYSYEYARAIEGTIFIGMVARHMDGSKKAEKRALAMYLTGIKILNEVMEVMND